MREKLLYPYQQKWFNDQSRFKIALKSRQIGYSTLFGIEALLEATEKARKILLVSASERQSKELLEKVYKWDRLINKTSGKSLLKNQSKTECTTVSGGVILSLPANPHTIRGFTGSVFLDEFAFHQQANEIFKSVFPMIIRNPSFKLRIGSTPCGDVGKFYDLWINDNSFSKHRVTLDDAIADGIPVDKNEILANFTLDEYLQEFDCQFISSNSTFITMALLQRAFISDWCTLRGNLPKPESIYVGVDIGRHHDLTVIYVIEKHGEMFYERERIELQNVPFANQKTQLRDVIIKESPVRVCIDKTGLGMQFAEEFEYEYPLCCEGITFTNEVKAKMAGDLKDAFEREKIRIPPDKALINDIVKVKRKATVAGNVRFEAESSHDGHADRFWALALAVHASKIDGPPPATGNVDPDRGAYNSARRGRFR